MRQDVKVIILLHKEDWHLCRSHITNKKEKKALTDRYKGGLASLKYREKFNGRVRKDGEALHATCQWKTKRKNEMKNEKKKHSDQDGEGEVKEIWLLRTVNTNENPRWLNKNENFSLVV
jgi:hypothetical protein